MPPYLAPRLWGAHLLGVVCVCVALGFAWWQFGAFEAQRAAEAADLSRIEPEPLADVFGSDDPFPGDKVGQPVLVSGTWVPDGTVYIEGREQDGREGFWAVTPLAVGDGPTAPAIEIVRGWSATLDDAPPPPSGAAEVTAWLQPSEGTGEVDDDPTDDVLPQLRLGDLIQHVDQDLYSGYAIVAEPSRLAEGDWPAVNDGTAGLAYADPAALPQSSQFTGLRNFLYSLEWVVFAAFAAFIWWRYVRDVTSRPPEDEEDEPEREAVEVPSGP